MRSPLVAVAVGLSLLLPALEARPCSAPVCQDSDLVGRGTVPLNTAALVWTPYQPFIGDPGTITTSSVSLVASDGERVPVRLGAAIPDAYYAWEIAPERALREGITYQLEQPSFCGASSAPPSLGPIVVGPAAPLPTTLGALTVETATVGWLDIPHGASCATAAMSAHAGIELALSAEALPWRDALVFETYVDGQRWKPQRYTNRRVPAGESWSGRGRDRVYGVCPSTSFFDQRGVPLDVPHTVVMRATLPGTAVALETAPVTVMLSCTPPSPSIDAGVVDTGLADAAATSPGDADAGAAPDALPVVVETGDGCTCFAAAERASATWLVLGLALVVLRRRPRARD